MGYQVLTKLAINWRQVSSGNYVGTDRGSTADVYEAKFSIYGTESTINSFIDEIEANRTAYPSASSYILTLGSFQSGEYIFGENVDHTGSISATLLSIPKRKQGSFKGFGLADMYIRALSVSFTGASSLPTLQFCIPGGELDSDYTIRKNDTYDGTMAYKDHQADSGIFEGTFKLTNANMILIRNYIRTQRTGNFTLSDTFGVSYPFGKRSANSYPFTCKLIGWTDLGWWGLLYHRIRLRFAEAV
jgi:hypothetical protein